MNAGQNKGTGAFLKYRLFPYFPSAGQPEQEVVPGSAGSLIRRAVVFTRTSLFLDPDEPKN